MTARESLASARTALEMIGVVSTEEVIKRLASRALEDLAHAAESAALARATDAARKRKGRGHPRTSGGHDGTSSGLPGIPTESNGVREWGEGGEVLDLSSEDTHTQDLSVSVTGGDPGGVRRTPLDTRPTLAPTKRLIDPKLEIDDESRAAAQQIGILEIDVQWRRFVAKCIAQGETSADHRALFRSRLPFIRNDERRERGRDAAVPPSRQPPPGAPNGGGETPGAHRARQKRQDAERTKLEAEAVPAPIGDLLAAVGGKGPEATGPPSSAPSLAPDEPKTSPTIRRELTEAEREKRRQEQIAQAKTMEEQNGKTE